MFIKLIALTSLGALCLSGCTTSTHLKKVKLVSFVNDTSSGKSVGTLRGEDCSWQAFGYKIGTANITRAIDKARTGATDYDRGGEPVDFLKNVSSTQTRDNYVIVSKNCYTVSGTGYKKAK